MNEYNPEAPFAGFEYNHEKFSLPELTDSQKEFYINKVSEIKQRLKDLEAFYDKSRTDEELNTSIHQATYTLIFLNKIKDNWEIDTEEVRREIDSQPDTLILDQAEDCRGWNAAIEEVRGIIEEGKLIN